MYGRSCPGKNPLLNATLEMAVAKSEPTMGPAGTPAIVASTAPKVAEAMVTANPVAFCFFCTSTTAFGAAIGSVTVCWLISCAGACALSFALRFASIRPMICGKMI